MQLIKEKGIVVLDDDITLSSGEKTNYYYDLKKIASYAIGYNIAGVVCVVDREDNEQNQLRQNNIKYSSLFRHSDLKS